MRAVHLFAGGGGSLLAGDLLGWQHLAAAEMEPFAAGALAYRYPEVSVYGRVEKAPWELYAGRCDVAAAGWPCQPVSPAGRRQGAADERDGWPALAGALRDLRPRLALLENSPGVLTADGGRYWAGVLGDLAEIGLDVRWICIPASAAGASHERERLWALAYAPFARLEEREDLRGDGGEELAAPLGFVADSEGIGRGQGQSESAWQQGRLDAPLGGGSRRQALADASGIGRRWAGPLAQSSQGAGRYGEGASSVDGDHGDPTEPRLVRGAYGLAAGVLDWPAVRGDFPAPQGVPAHSWEPPRTCGTVPGRRQMIRVLGNGWVPAQAVLAWRLLGGPLA